MELLTTSKSATLMVVARTCDVNNTTLVSYGGCLNHVVGQQMCQQERPYNTLLHFILLIKITSTQYVHLSLIHI